MNANQLQAARSYSLHRAAPSRQGATMSIPRDHAGQSVGAWACEWAGVVIAGGILCVWFLGCVMFGHKREPRDE